MSDYDARMKSISEKGIDRIKASSAEIVVHGTKEKPYFEIKYFDLSDNDFHIGFSSYDLNIVFEYLGNFFEIVNNKSNFENQCKEFENDLISRKAVINAVDRHTREDETLDDDISVILEEVKTVFDKEKVIEKLKISMSSVQSISGQAVTFAFADGYYNGIKDAIEIVEKGGIK